MRVVHVVPALFGTDGIVGGAERYAFELARHMAHIVPTTLVTFGNEDREERFEGLRVRVIGRAWHVRGQRTNAFHLKLLGALRGADVVHCHQQHVLASSLVALWCRATGRRVFVSELGGGGWDLSAYVSTDAWYHGHLHISAYSRHVSGHDDQSHAHVILGGVDTEKFSPDPSVARGDRALFVGRLLPHKGVSGLLQALPRGSRLTVVGPKPAADMSARLHALAEGKDVTFKHGLDDVALVQEYRKALCVVLPSVYRAPEGVETNVPELLGQTLLEGMACGLPALCTNVASLPEVVVDGVTGFVVPPNDPEALAFRLQWLQEHPREARAMGEAGRKRVLEHFTWDQVVRRCLELYGPRASSIAPARAIAAAMITLLLVGGFARGAVTIGQQCAEMWRQNNAVGPFASTDRYLDGGDGRGSKGVFESIAAAGVPPNADVAFIAPLSRVPPNEFWQAYFTSSYLLYPRRVWPVAWCDDVASQCAVVGSTSDVEASIVGTRSRFAVLMRMVGRDPPLAHGTEHNISSGLALVALTER